VRSASRKPSPAIKYNAAQRLRGMEEAVAQGTADVAKFDMLPKLVASAGYRYRDKDLISRSTDSVTGAPSLAHPYISSDRESTLTSLSFSWSLLDFGQSYAARQHADRVQIAAERRRKAIHTLIQDVRIAYWRVAAAQTLESSLRTASQDADKALNDSRKVEAEKLRSPLEPLRYQRQLLENIRLLEAVQQELSSARIELASLMGLQPSALALPLRVVEPAASMPSAGWSSPWTSWRTGPCCSTPTCARACTTRALPMKRPNVSCCACSPVCPSTTASTRAPIAI
jgi:outer membrane protein TolC